MTDPKTPGHYLKTEFLSEAARHHARHYGFDVSHHQEPDGWDWSSLAFNGYGMIARCSYGDQPDETFTTYVQRCRDHRVAIGAYHFLRQGIPLGQQIHLWREQMELMRLMCPGTCMLPCLDLEPNNEHDGQLKPGPFAAMAERFATYAADLYGGCILYYSATFPLELGEPDWMLRPCFRHWVADWNAPPGKEPRHPHTPSWDLHQPAAAVTPLYRGGAEKVDHIWQRQQTADALYADLFIQGELPEACRAD